MRQISIAISLMISTTAYSQTPVVEITSPDHTKTLVVESQSGALRYTVSDGEEILIKPSRMGLLLSDSTEIGVGGDIRPVSVTQYRGVMESRLSERSNQIDNYNQALISASKNGVEAIISIRLYNEGLGIRYEIDSRNSVSMDSDNTTFDLSGHNGTAYVESGTESGYTKIKATNASLSSLTPLFVQGDNWAFTINEAANVGIASKAEISGRFGTFRFVQTNRGGKKWSTPWRYIVWGATPREMIDGKYIVRSLNEECEETTEWIRPGKVFRSLATGTTTFFTDTVAQAIEFASSMNFQYVLLDAGWYGLGYSHESSPSSNPLKPVSTLDIEEVTEQAKAKDVGIITYVNRSAWANYDNSSIFRTYSGWGVDGIKMGFVDAFSETGLDKIYGNIRKAFDKKMLINVHDNMRPTGAERTWPNLMTTEGIKGGENETTFTTSHDMLLPFTRFMSGPADYTIIYQGYSGVPSKKIDALKATKGHQLALSVIFFSPLQHIFWYGKYWMYLTHPVETEVFRELETVWDDYKVVDGEPGEHFTIARRSDEQWFLASATNETARSRDIPLDFLDEGEYEAFLYEDDANGSIRKSALTDLSNKSTIRLALLGNGGAVAIINKKELVTSVESKRHDDVNATVFHLGDEILLSEPATEICLYNTYGIVVRAKRNATSLPTAGLSRGIYIIRVRNSGSGFSRKITIR